MSNHELWKSDAQQLKQDLDKREKKIVRREVPITLNSTPKNKKTSTTPNSLPHAGPQRAEDYLKQQLGL